MKSIRLLLCLALFSSSLQVVASWDIYKTGLNLNGGYYDCQLNTIAPDFANNNFGRFTTAGTLTLNFSEMLTYKNGASNSCGGNLRYRVYRTSDAAPAYSTLALSFCCDNGQTNACSGGVCGPDVNNPGDQKWKGIPGSTVNLINGLTLPGTYIIEVYFDATGDDAGGCSVIKYSSNGGANYKAYFEFSNSESFTDGNFTASPVWTGDVSSFQIVNNSTTSGLTGTEANRTHTAQLNVASGAGTQSISTQIATWDQQQEWYFWIGRNALGGGSPQDFDASNQQSIWLYANESTLESGTVDGYRILIGESSTSYIRLQRIDNGAATTIFTSTTGIPNGRVDFGISFKVTRSQTGKWVIRTSTLPTDASSTQSTPTPNSAVETLSTVNHGNITDNTYVPAANGYFGFQAIHDSSPEGRIAAEFDSFRFLALPPDTYVQINGSISSSVAEDAALAGNIDIAVDLTNPSSTVATTVDLVLISGAATRAGGGLTAATAYAPSYTTLTVTWPAGNSAPKHFYIDPDDNDLCDDIATLVFKLQNPTGGNNAFVGAADTYTATIVDDNMGYETLLSDNFESGSLTSWVTTGTAWSASTTSPIDGTRSAHHSTQTITSQSSLTYPIDDNTLTGVNTIWRFEANFANDATANNNFQIFLSSTENNLYSATVDGYAVVIDQNALPTAGGNDYIRLYRVDNGVYSSTPIFTNTINLDWETDVVGGNRVGFEVYLNDAGTWTVKVDANGGFDALTTIGSGTDLAGGGLTYPVMKGFGMRFKYTPSVSDYLRFDNVTVTQNGCKEIWYSRAPGNTTGAIWSSQPTGLPAPAIVVGGRYDRFQVQSSHTVTVNGTWTTRSIAIDNGGNLTGSNGAIKVYENWINDGTFLPGTSSVTFKGQLAQSILGAVTTTFNNLVIDNDGSNVTVTTAANVNGVVSMEEGTLQTGGILTLISNATGSASIGEIKSGAAVSGNITLQRYTPSIPYVYGSWVNLGCPLTGQTIASWNDDITTSGFTGSDFPTYPFNNIRSYDETVSGIMNVGYQNATNITNALDNSKGYFVWLEGPAQNIDNTGAIQSGTFTKPLSYTVTSAGGIFDYGWNLMTNPYPSEVDWNLVSSTLTGPKVYYVFDYQTNAYKFWNAGTNTGGASRYIPHSQSFLMKVNAAGQSLAFQENYKTNVGAAFERSGESNGGFIALQLARNGMMDESFLIFRDDAIAEYDNLDVYDLESPNAESVEFSLMSADEIALAQDARPFSNDIVIPVNIQLPSAGSYTFTVSELQELPLGSCLFVEDLFTGNFMNLEVGQSMTLTTDSAYQGVRLMIHGSAPIDVFATHASCFGEADGSIDVTTPNGNWAVTLADDLNDLEYVSAGSMTFDHLPAGIYELTVNNADGACGASNSTVIVEEPLEITLSVGEIIIVPCNVGSAGSIGWSVNNAEWFSYDIVDAAGTVVLTGNVEGSSGIVEQMSAGLYTVNIYSTCGSESFVADLHDPESNSLQYEAMASEFTAGAAEITLDITAPYSDAVNVTLNNGVNTWEFENVGDQLIAPVNAAGNYHYTITAVGNCTQIQEGDIAVESAVSIQENTGLAAISILQSAGGVFVNFNKVNTESCTVKLLDVTGKEIYSRKAAMINGSNLFVDTTHLSAGLYFVQVQSGGYKLFTQKVIKK